MKLQRTLLGTTAIAGIQLPAHASALAASLATPSANTATGHKRLIAPTCQGKTTLVSVLRHIEYAHQRLTSYRQAYLH